MQPKNQIFSALLIRRILFCIGIAAILCSAWLIYYSTFVFHIIKTDPELSAVSNFSPYIRVYFNQSLDSSSLQVDDPGNILNTNKVDNKTVTLSFVNDLTVGKKYTITIARIASRNGKQITNRVLSFTAKDISVSDLSPEQQKALINSQDTYPYVIDYINFIGFDALTNNGMSSSQLQSVKQSLLDYSNILGREYWTITIVPNSVQAKLHDSESESTVDTQRFKVQYDKMIFDAIASYDLLDDTAKLQIYKAGSLVYDSSDYSG